MTTASAEENPLHSQIEAANFAVGQEFLVPLPPSFPLPSSAPSGWRMQCGRRKSREQKLNPLTRLPLAAHQMRARDAMKWLPLLCYGAILSPCIWPLAECVKCVAPPLDWSASLNTEPTSIMIARIFLMISMMHISVMSARSVNLLTRLPVSQSPEHCRTHRNLGKRYSVL